MVRTRASSLFGGGGPAASACLAAALAACSPALAPALAPAPAPEPALVAQDDRLDASAETVDAREPDTREIYVLLSRGTDPIDRVAVLDETLSVARSLDVPGTHSCGVIPPGGGSAVLVVPRTPVGDQRPSLLLLDLDRSSQSVLCRHEARLDLWRGWDRPPEPFVVGDDLPDLVAVPLLAEIGGSARYAPGMLRVVDVRKRTWSDVAVPFVVRFGALFASEDSGLHAAVVTNDNELFDVDLNSGHTRAVPAGSFAPDPRPRPRENEWRGFVLVPDEPRVLAVNHGGDAVRVALADGSETPVELPVSGLGDRAFVEAVSWSRAAQRFALSVLRTEDTLDDAAHVVILDGDLRATGVEIDTPFGLRQTEFSPRGTELIVVLYGGSVRRYRVSDGALLSASRPGLQVDALLGVR